MWIRLATGEIARILPIPRGWESIYACLPHLRPSLVFSPEKPDGQAADVDLALGVAATPDELESARAAGWLP
jgi:hypothetical protein